MYLIHIPLKTALFTCPTLQIFKGYIYIFIVEIKSTHKELLGTILLLLSGM